MKSVLFVFIVIVIPITTYAATMKVPSQYPSIQVAIDASSGGDTVLVAPGIFVENIDFIGKAIILMSEQGPNVTFIDGSGSGTAVTCQSGEGADTVLDGFTITNASAQSGGGMSNTNNSDTTVVNCIFTGNSALKGGGMFNDSTSDPTVTNCTFSGNEADFGGGIYNLGGNPTIINCIFSENSANGGYWGGGGMFNDYSTPMVINCSFDSNSAYFDGGGMFNRSSWPTVTNCTFSGNYCGHEGGGMHNLSSFTTVINCILWNDTPDEIVGTSFDSVTYSDVQGGYPGTANIDADPLFVNPSAGDFHLTFLSPCKDTGDSTAVTEGFDFEGDPRIAYGTVDMGADEFYTHLYYTGDATPGGNVQIKFIGIPGTSPVGLCLGTGVFDPPIPSMWGDWHLTFPIRGPVNLGSITSPEGVLIIPATIPGSPPAPFSIPMQALIGAELTNLCVLEVE